MYGALLSLASGGPDGGQVVGDFAGSGEADLDGCLGQVPWAVGHWAVRGQGSEADVRVAGVDAR